MIGNRIFMGMNFISWRSKKQVVITKTNVESNDKVMAEIITKMTWIRVILENLGVPLNNPMLMNRAATHIASNHIFYERTKHVEVDCHYIHDLA